MTLGSEDHGRFGDLGDALTATFLKDKLMPKRPGADAAGQSPAELRVLISKAVEVAASLLTRMEEDAMTHNPAEMAQALGRLVKSLDQLMRLDDKAKGPEPSGPSAAALELRARIKRRLDELALD